MHNVKDKGVRQDTRSTSRPFLHNYVVPETTKMSETIPRHIYYVTSITANLFDYSNRFKFYCFYFIMRILLTLIWIRNLMFFFCGFDFCKSILK